MSQYWYHWCKADNWSANYVNFVKAEIGLKLKLS